MKFLCILIVILIHESTCWDNEELEVFDVVEEVGQNFYELMKISKDASLSEIKKAYRTLSIQLHPDKNSADDAEIRFREMVSVYEILKDKNKRACYDRVLIEGLPDWRSPIFYYRRVRKLSLFESTLIITIVISITQYLMAWGSYLDTKHTMQEFLMKKYKIKDRRKKKAEDCENEKLMQCELDQIQKPKCWNILPIQLIQFLFFLVTNGPFLIKRYIVQIREESKRIVEEKEREIELENRIKEEEERRKEKKSQMKLRKRTPKLPDYTGKESPELNYLQQNTEEVEEPEPVITGGPWTEEDFNQLTQLMNKFPGGTLNRWEVISSQMNRTVFEVTKMSKRILERMTAMKASVNVENTTEEIIKVKSKTKGGKSGTNENIETDAGSDELWSVTQQKSLEKAIKLVPKGVDQRWDKISNYVTDKTKEECMMRFKFLAERIKRKKEEEINCDNITISNGSAE